MRALELHLQEWQSYRESIPPATDALVKTRRTTWWFARWVQEQGRRAHVVDPTRSRVVAAGLPKTDRSDALRVAGPAHKAPPYTCLRYPTEYKSPMCAEPRSSPGGICPSVDLTLAGGLLLPRHKPSLTRRFAVYFLRRREHPIFDWQREMLFDCEH